MTPLRGLGAEAVANMWNAAVSAKYRIDAALVAQNLIDHPLLHDTASLTDGETFVAVKRSASGLYDGPDPKTAHLSLLGPGSTRMIAAAATILSSEGYDALVVGTDSGHFLPGAPTDIPWLGSLLKGSGFEAGGLSFDLERDLKALPDEPLDPRYDGRTCGAEDLDALDGFLAREFPLRWRYDTMRKVRAEGSSTVFGLFQDARCEGFALLQREGCLLPIGGATWRSDLGPLWGSLGPIGISERLRGGGLGRSFLNRALTELRSHGVRRTIIDWTGLVDLYGTQGFSVNRAYRSYRLSLPAERSSSV